MTHEILIDMLKSMSLDSGIVTLPAQAGTVILHDATKNWMANKYTGCIVRIIDGHSCGQCARIMGNDQNTLTVTPAWLEGLDETSHYIIYQVAVSRQVNDILHRIKLITGKLDTIETKLAEIETKINGLI